MYTVDILVGEHDNILKFTKELRKRLVLILKGEEVDIVFFKDAIKFVRKYADKQHHGKEEQILFDIMLNKLGNVAQKLIKMGMLVEHDLGRLHISELESALDRYEKSRSDEDKLDIITHAGGYIDLITRHISKENEAVFEFAKRALEKEDKEFVDIKTREFCETQNNEEESKYYLEWLNKICG